MTLDEGDVVALSGPRQIIVELVGPAPRRSRTRNSWMSRSRPPMSSLSIGSLQARTLGEASRQDWTRGLYLRSLSRGGQQIPIAAGVVLQRGDLLRIVGPEPVVAEGGSENRRHHRSQLKHRFRRVGACDFPRRRHWRSRDIFRRKRQNLPRHKHRHAARWTCGRSSPHPYPLFGRIPTAPSPL